MKLYQSEQALCVKYMDQIAITCVYVICNEKAADLMKPQFKREVGQFIKNVVVHHSAAKLQELEGLMAADEKAELTKYVQ